MQVTNNLKIELFTELTDQFPEKANEIIQAAQELCLSQNEFAGLSEEKQADVIINKIFDEPQLLGEDIYLFLEINSYLKKSALNTATDDLLTESKNISKHAFFNKESVNNARKENDIDEIKALLEVISTFIKKVSSVAVETSFDLKAQIDFLTKMGQLPGNSGLKRQKEELQKHYTRLTEFQNKLPEINKDSHDRYKQVEEQLVKINSQSEKDSFLQKIQNVEGEFKKVFSEQERLIVQVADFQILPMEKILDFPDFINEFATLLLSYPVLRSLIKACELNNYSAEKLHSLKNMEEELLKKVKSFVEKSQKSFEKGLLLDTKEKNKTFRHKFIAPLEARFDPDSLQILLCMLDSVF